MPQSSTLPLTPLSFQILIALADEPRHGYGIIKEIEERAGQPLKSSTGTLYLAIQRLEQEGLIAEEKELRGDGDARRRYYRLTAAGREVAAAETSRLATLLGVARDKRVIDSRELDALLRSGGGAA